MAAAVILDPAKPIPGLNDSKKLSEKKREALAILIRERAVAWCVASASVEEIDRLNILHATMLAMQRAVAGLTGAGQAARWSMAIGVHPSIFRLKRSSKAMARLPRLPLPRFWPKPYVMQEMLALHAQYPQYGFDRHMGYPTAAHFAALEAHGASPVHRKSFGPVAKQLSLL